MPIYEYRCAACGHTLETMQKVSDPPPGLCPACNAKGPLERLVSRTSFQLKGGGWYSDLYGSVKKDGKSEGSAPSAPAEKADKPAGSTAPAAASSTSSATPSAPAAGGAGSAKGGGSAAP